MSAHADIWDVREPLKKQVIASVGLHLFLLIFIAVGGYFDTRRGEDWGGADMGGGGAMSATIVSTIPLPSRQTESENVLATESAGLSQSVPQPKAPTPEPDAVAIPERNAKKTTPATAPQRAPQLQKPLPAVENQIPFGQGGPTGQQYATFSGTTGTGGIAAGGDFGNRYSWYVDQVRRVISQNWLRYEVDPRVQEGKRVYITFDILRNGEPTNVEIATSSGVPSLDVSAMRTLQRIDKFAPLPPEYRGDRVSVEFYFEYKK